MDNLKIRYLTNVGVHFLQNSFTDTEEKQRCAQKAT